jgi:hypothetical protein
LIGCASVLMPSCSAVLWRRCQRNRCDFRCRRLVAAVARTGRGRCPIESPLAGKHLALTSRAFLLTDAVVRPQRLPGGSGNLLPFASGSDAHAAHSAACRNAATGFPFRSRPQHDLSAAWTSSSGYAPGRGICAMSAGDHNFHPRQPGFCRVHSSTPANAFLAPAVDPANGIPGTTCRWEGMATTESEPDPHGRRSDATE